MKSLLKNKIVAAGLIICMAVIVLLVVRQNTVFDILICSVSLTMVCISALTDIKDNEIPNNILIVDLAAILVISAISGGIYGFVQSIVSGIIIMAVMLLCYIISRHQIGMGDVKLLAVLGAAFGVSECACIAFYSLGYCCIFGIIMMIVKKYKIKAEIPFAPFLFLGLITEQLVFYII